MSFMPESEVPRGAEWTLEAACRDCSEKDFNALFFPVADLDLQACYAKAKYCNACPVQIECETYMLSLNIREGVWNGKTADQVQRENRRTRRRRPMAA